MYTRTNSRQHHLRLLRNRRQGGRSGRHEGHDHGVIAPRPDRRQPQFLYNPRSRRDHSTRAATRDIFFVVVPTVAYGGRKARKEHIKEAQLRSSPKIHSETGESRGRQCKVDWTMSWRAGRDHHRPGREDCPRWRRRRRRRLYEKLYVRKRPWRFALPRTSQLAQMK